MDSLRHLRGITRGGRGSTCSLHTDISHTIRSHLSCFAQAIFVQRAVPSVMPLYPTLATLPSLGLFRRPHRDLLGCLLSLDCWPFLRRLPSVLKSIILYGGRPRPFTADAPMWSILRLILLSVVQSSFVIVIGLVALLRLFVVFILIGWTFIINYMSTIPIVSGFETLLPS